MTPLQKTPEFQEWRKRAILNLIPPDATPHSPLTQDERVVLSAINRSIMALRIGSDEAKSFVQSLAKLRGSYEDLFCQYARIFLQIPIDQPCW